MREYILGNGTILYFDCGGDYMTLSLSKFTEVNAKKHEFYCI